MALMNAIKNSMLKFLGINPNMSIPNFIINESETHMTAVLRNQLWYRGDPVELEQFYKQLGESDTAIFSKTVKNKFWAAVPNGNVSVRKIHSGLPAMIVDTLSNLIVSDMMEPVLNTQDKSRWEEFCTENDFEDIVADALTQVMVSGDGAFKINVDPEISMQPLVEFYPSDKVDYEYKSGKLQCVTFKTEYRHENKCYVLFENYAKNSVSYNLKTTNNHEVPLDTIPETAMLEDVVFSGDYIMAVPFKLFKSPKYCDRGQSLYEKKSDNFDALDEIISTWVDAVRAGRVKQYIPTSLIPKRDDGTEMAPDVFNPYYVVSADLGEDGKSKVEVVQGNINTDQLLNSYVTVLDLCLQGLISPSTLGIDVKKLDNAESQREKEKTTMYTRDNIIKVLQKVLSQLFDVVLKTQDNIRLVSPPAEKYEATFEWGQYANPSFEAIIETMVKAKQGQVMSTERIVDELYGDNMDEDEKAEEVLRIKEEYGSPSFETEPPAIGDDANLFGKDNEQYESDDAEGTRPVTEPEDTAPNGENK